MTRVPTIMVTYAELHKLRVVISSREGGGLETKGTNRGDGLGFCFPSAQSFDPLQEYTNSFRRNQLGSFKVHASVTF